MANPGYEGETGTSSDEQLIEGPTVGGYRGGGVRLQVDSISCGGGYSGRDERVDEVDCALAKTARACPGHVAGCPPWRGLRGRTVAGGVARGHAPIVNAILFPFSGSRSRFAVGCPSYRLWELAH